MALQFPNSPSVGQIYIDTASGFSYEWDGTVWKSFSEASASQISILDDISGLFDGIETSFALTSSSVSVTPVSSQSIIVNLGGVVQDPSDDYSISGSNLIFSTAPTAGLTFSGVLLGSAFSITRTEIQSADDTTTNSTFYPVIVASTNADAKISTTKLSFNPSSGTLTATAFAGNLTGNVTGNSTGLSGTPNITVANVTSGNVNSSGIVTASSFSGNLTGNVTGNATGLSGNPSITVTNATVNGVLSVGGTTVILNAATLQVKDKDIVVGYTTDALGNDVSNDTTANHGGVAVASTTGTPLMNIDAVGIDSIPNTYKQIMWIKSGTLSGLGTDAWVFNYPVSIGNTATVQNNSRLTVGAGFTVYEGYIDTKDIRAININSVGVITASVFKGDGSQLQGVTAGLNLRQAGTAVAGGAATTVNFASGATISNVTSGIATITIAAGIQTEAATPNNTTTFLDLSKQDHKLTVSGITTISCTGGTEGDSHTVRIVNSGISTVGFSTAFLFPSGSPPVLPTTSGAISIVSFTVHRVGTAGTQLLAGASLNFS